MARTTAKEVANYIIHFCHEHGDWITNLKLQKLVYYTQGWFLALYDEPLFNDRLEAWVHGPVQPSLYHDFKQFGWNPITTDPGQPALPELVRSHIEEVLSVYGSMSAYDLERLTHREKPWIIARGDLPKDEASDAVISTEEMKRFYKIMANERDQG